MESIAIGMLLGGVISGAIVAVDWFVFHPRRLARIQRLQAELDADIDAIDVRR